MMDEQSKKIFADAEELTKAIFALFASVNADPAVVIVALRIARVVAVQKLGSVELVKKLEAAVDYGAVMAVSKGEQA